MLLKDVMNFLNACAVAKTCRDAEKILALDVYKRQGIKVTAKANNISEIKADFFMFLFLTEISASKLEKSLNI